MMGLQKQENSYTGKVTEIERGIGSAGEDTRALELLIRERDRDEAERFLPYERERADFFPFAFRRKRDRRDRDGKREVRDREGFLSTIREENRWRD